MKGPRLAVHLCSITQTIVPAIVLPALYYTAGAEPVALGGMAFASFVALTAVELFHPLTLPIFAAALGWNFYQTSLLAGADTAPLMVVVAAFALQAINLAIVGGFLARTLYVAYGNPEQRWWWEENPRYRVKLPVQMTFKGESHYGRILDISSGGILVDTGKKGWLSPGDVVELRFQFHNLQIAVSARNIHHGVADRNLCGMAFHRPGRANRRRIRQLIGVFQFLGFERRVASASWFTELVQALRKEPVAAEPLRDAPDADYALDADNAKTEHEAA